MGMECSSRQHPTTSQRLRRKSIGLNQANESHRVFHRPGLVLWEFEEGTQHFFVSEPCNSRSNWKENAVHCGERSAMLLTIWNVFAMWFENELGSENTMMARKNDRRLESKLDVFAETILTKRKHLGRWTATWFSKRLVDR